MEFNKDTRFLCIEACVRVWVSRDVRETVNSLGDFRQVISVAAVSYNQSALIGVARWVVIITGAIDGWLHYTQRYRLKVIEHEQSREVDYLAL